MGRVVNSHVGRRSCRGYTLPELLVAMAVTGLLVQAGMGMGKLLARERQAAALIELQGLVQFARVQAVNLQNEVVLCALDDSQECSSQWTGRQIAVFVDANRDHRLDDGEALRLTHWPAARGELHWRAALGRPYLRFSAMGSTYQNGSFVWCYTAGVEEAGDRRPDVVLTLNRGGRPYFNTSGRRRCPGR